MPDPAPLRPEESEEARLEQKARAWLRSSRMSTTRASGLAALLRSERRDAMERAAKILEGWRLDYQEGHTEACGCSECYARGAHNALVVDLAAAIRREIGE